MLVLACVLFVLLFVFIIGFSIYKIFQLNKKTPMKILEELNRKRDKKLTSYLKKETKSMFTSDDLKAALCCFGKRKDRSGTPSINKQNKQQSAAAEGVEQLAPTPLPRTNFNYVPPPTADNDQQLAGAAGSTNDDDDMHETTSRSSFDDDDDVDDAHLYDDVPENGNDPDDYDVRSFDPEDEENFYSVPSYDGAASDPSRALDTTIACYDDDKDAIFPEPLITTV